MYMAKRFFDTDFFKKKFIRDLDAPYKLLWFYIMTDCNHAGIWEVDFEVAQIRLKVDVNENTSAEIFQGKIVKVDSGDKWFIPSFIEFQYGELNEKNNAHLSVIQILTKYSLLNEVAHKPLVSPSEGAMDKDKEMDKAKDIDKDNFIKEPREEISTLPLANTEIDILTEFFLEQIERTTLEGDPDTNRFECQDVLDDCSDNYPDENRVALIKHIIVGGLADSFHKKNMVGFGYIKRNFIKLFNATKGKETTEERYIRQKKLIVGDAAKTNPRSITGR